MFERVTRNTVCTLVLLGLVGSETRAQQPLPPQPITQDVVYRIHDDPNDPNSAIVFTIWLSLEKEEVDGDSVGWEIKDIQFRQIGDGGDPDTIWVESDPNVPTADGLWWVEHVDRDSPQLDEFDEPPHLVGTATAEDPNDADLKYDFEGVSYTPPPGGLSWNPTGALDYEFTPEGQQDPIESGTDEPIEIDDDDDEPPME